MDARLLQYLNLAALLLPVSCAPSVVAGVSSVRTLTVATGREPLAYVEAGDGEPLIMIHGGFQDYRLWLPFMPALSASHRVIAYSRRNHWPNAASPNGTADFAADEHAQDLLGLMDALGSGAVHLVAHSSGAATALFFAAQHPRRVRSLVIVEPPLASMLIAAPEDQEAARAFRSNMGEALAKLRRRDDVAAVRLFADAVGGPGTYERRSAAQKRMMLDNISAHVADAIAIRPRPAFSCAMAGRVDMPVLLVSGTRSPSFFHRIADRLSDCLPNDQRVAIEASHTVPGENPGRFQKELLAFLAQQSGRVR